MKRVSLCVALVTSSFVYSQEKAIPNSPYNQAGTLEIGTRGTVSLFENDGNTGQGFGGQFRIRLSKRVNTEWYSDYILTNLSNLGNRQTGHIGWSVMFYLKENPVLFSPYLVAGHCFDYAKITIYDENKSSKKRVSSAIQIGLGNSFALSDRLDFTLTAQYMMHIGQDIHTYQTSIDNQPALSFDNPNEEVHSHSHGLQAEGHVLVTASINYKIYTLW